MASKIIQPKAGTGRSMGTKHSNKIWKFVVKRLRKPNYYLQTPNPLWASLILLLFVPSLVLADVPLSVEYDAVYFNEVARANCGNGAGGAIPNGVDNVDTAFKFFSSGDKGLTPIQVAGIVGNIRWESGGPSGVINPTAQEVHPGVPTPIPNEGFGIAQWTTPGRQQNLVAFAQAAGQPVNTLAPQLGFLWKEFTESYPDTYVKLKTATTIRDATDIFQRGFEGAGDVHLEERIGHAQSAFDMYGGGGAGGTVSSSGCRGGLGVSGNFVFPERTTQSAVKGGGWCFAQQTSCHHDYYAADIMNQVGTPVVASVGGTVLRAVETSCTGGLNVPRVQIQGTDGVYYYYTHMRPGSIKVHDGEHVAAGEEIGAIGPTECAEGSSPHLHFQMSSVPISNTEDPTERQSYIDPQPNLTASFAKLPE